MLPRRWLQFSLRFLFAATLLAASVAWWFRPGVVKPEFALEQISRQDSGKYASLLVVVRLINRGADTISFNGLDVYLSENRAAMDGDGLEEFHKEKVSIVHDPARAARIRLKPGESSLISVAAGIHNAKINTIQLGADIVDRRGGKKRTYWSPVFAVPDNL